MDKNIFTILGLKECVYLGHQGSHMLKKYLNLNGFFEKSLKNKYSSFKDLEKSLNSSFFCRT